MSRVRGSLDIARPVEVVFDAVADQRNEPSYNPTMTAATKVTDGPIGVGTRFEATVMSRGTPQPVTIEYTGFERPHRIDSHSAMAGATVQGHVQCDPDTGRHPLLLGLDGHADRPGQVRRPAGRPDRATPGTNHLDRPQEVPRGHLDPPNARVAVTPGARSRQIVGGADRCERTRQLRDAHMEGEVVEKIAWLVLGGVTFVAALRAGSSPRAMYVGRAALGVLFIVFGALVNAIYLIAQPQYYATFAEASPFPFVTDTWNTLVLPHETFFITVLIIFEAAMGVLILSGGRWTQFGLIGLIGFHVGQLAFGGVSGPGRRSC